MAQLKDSTINGNPVWHAGNDGTGSGLDADTLDGQHGSYYYSSANPPPSSLSITSQTFSGNGSTTAFTMNRSVSNAAFIIVSISGVFQYPTSSYTVSATTLTFTSAPPNGTTIEVRYLF